jgi:hypothetical protein
MQEATCYVDEPLAVARAISLLRCEGVERREVVLPSCADLEDVFAEMNGHGPSGRFPDGYRGRSLSVGDVVWDPAGQGWLCAAAGWQELTGLRLPAKATEPVYTAPSLAECAATVIDQLEREAELEAAVGAADEAWDRMTNVAPLTREEWAEEERRQAAEAQAAARQSAEREREAAQAMKAGTWGRTHGLPDIDFGGLVERGVAVSVLADQAFHTLIGEAVDLGGRRPNGQAPVLYEAPDEVDFAGLKQVTLVRSGADALARRTLRPDERELLVVLNGAVTGERLADVEMLVSEFCNDLRRSWGAVDPTASTDNSHLPPGPVVSVVSHTGPIPVVVAVPAGSVEEAAERRRLIATLASHLPATRFRVEQDHPRGKDWMEDLRRTKGITVQRDLKGVRL